MRMVLAIAVAGIATFSTLQVQVRAQAPVPSDGTQSALLSMSLDLVVVPAKGQSREAQGADETECYAVTKQETGVDPFAAPAPTAVRRALFDKGFTACLEARGYTVK
jgi:hypothetical protein